MNWSSRLERDPDVVERLIKLWPNATLEEMSRRLEVSTTTIKRWGEQLGFASKGSSRVRYRRLTPENVAAIRSFWGNTPIKVIAEALNLSETAVRRCAQTEGLHVPRDRNGVQPAAVRQMEFEKRYPRSATPPLARPDWFDEPELEKRLTAGR